MNPEVLEELDIVTITLPTPFPVGPVNAFLVKGEPLVLIDTGLKSEESYNAVVGQLKEHGYAIGDLDAIVATHGHRDHMGLLGRLQQETEAKIYGHPDVAKLGVPGADTSAERKAFYEGILAEFGVAPYVIERANSLYDRFRSFSEPFSVDHVIEDEEVSFSTPPTMCRVIPLRTPCLSTPSVRSPSAETIYW